MKAYVISRSGEEIGIYTFPQLKEKVQSGEVLPTDEIKGQGAGESRTIIMDSELAAIIESKTESKQQTSDSFGLIPSSSDSSGIDMKPLAPLDNFEDDEEIEQVGSGAFESMGEYDSLADQENSKPEETLNISSDSKDTTRKSMFFSHAVLAQRTGYALQFSGIVVLILFAQQVASETNTTSLVMTTTGWSLATIVGIIAAVLCRQAGLRDIAGVRTRVRSGSTLILVGSVILTIGLALFVAMALVSTIVLSFWPVIYGLLLLLSCVLGAGVALSPTIMNVAFDENIESMTEAIGLITLYAKAIFLLGPFVLICCSSIGLIKGWMLLYSLWNSEQAMNSIDIDAWIAPGSILLAGSFFQLIAYIFLLTIHMIDRMLNERSISSS